MVSAINSVNKYPLNRDALEVARRLQSLGLAPSGNLTVDRQRLQTAELQKRQSTLAANSEINLSKLEGTKYNFSSTIDSIQNNKTGTNSNTTDREMGLINIGQVQSVPNDNFQYQMTGALQIAELNKLKLGLTA